MRQTFSQPSLSVSTAEDAAGHGSENGLCACQAWADPSSMKPIEWKRFGSDESVGYFESKPFHVLAAHQGQWAMPVMPFSWAGIAGWPGVLLHANRKGDMSSESCGMSKGLRPRALHAGAKTQSHRCSNPPLSLASNGLPSLLLRRGKQRKQTNHTARRLTDFRRHVCARSNLQNLQVSVRLRNSSSPSRGRRWRGTPARAR